MSSVEAGTTFETRVQGFPTGLLGTVGVRILDNIGNTVLARSTVGITEDPTGSGSYVKVLTAPLDPGQYSVMWDWGVEPPKTAFEDLLVTITSARSVGPVSEFTGTIPNEPHFDLPFRLRGSSFATVQQDSSEDIANCVECIVRTPLGFREDNENIGLEDLTFSNQPFNLESIKANILQQEPRAGLMLEQDVQNLISKVTIRVGK